MQVTQWVSFLPSTICFKKYSPPYLRFPSACLAYLAQANDMTLYSFPLSLFPPKYFPLTASGLRFRVSRSKQKNALFVVRWVLFCHWVKQKEQRRWQALGPDAEYVTAMAAAAQEVLGVPIDPSARPRPKKCWYSSRSPWFLFVAILSGKKTSHTLFSRKKELVFMRVRIKDPALHWWQWFHVFS